MVIFIFLLLTLTHTNIWQQLWITSQNWLKINPYRINQPKVLKVFDWSHQTFMCICTNQWSRQGICQSHMWGKTLTGDRKQFARAHNPRARKLVKWQNWTVKDKSLKVERVSSSCLAKFGEFFTVILFYIKNMSKLFIYITNSVTASL